MILLGLRHTPWRSWHMLDASCATLSDAILLSQGFLPVARQQWHQRLSQEEMPQVIYACRAQDMRVKTWPSCKASKHVQWQAVVLPNWYS